MPLEPDHLPEATASPAASGKDEMNFAEHPIALLTDKVPKGQRSIKFEDTVYDERRKRLVPCKRIIEGSEEYGLPTATDDTVVLALIQLTKLKNDFTRPAIEFTRLELIRLLGWPNEGKSYDRIKLSLLRIKGVNYFYDNAWWDPRQKKWTTKAFSIIDIVEINDSRAATGQGGLFPSRIVWNEVVFDSFQAGFLRNIDFHLCMTFKHPTALRIYRFLGKRFYVKPDWTFDLKEFAYKHVGLGSSYEGGTQIARKLQPAIEELENAAFLEPLPESERFQKKGREWSIRFVQKTLALTPAMPAPSPDAAEPEPPLVAELAKRGVSAKKAAELVQKHPAETIQLKIDIFDWLTERKDKRIGRSPAGYLVVSITDDYVAPEGFAGKAERERQAAESRQEDRATAEEGQRRREKATHDGKVAGYLRTMTPQARAEFEAVTLARADAASRQAYEEARPASLKKMWLDYIVRQQVRQILNLPPDEESPSPAP